MYRTTLSVLLIVFALFVAASVPNAVQADEEYNWEAEGKLACQGIYLQTVIEYELNKEIGIYKIHEGLSSICWFDYYDNSGDRSFSHYYPYGPLTPHDQFQVIKLDDTHFRFDNLTAKASGAYSTDGVPDRSKQ